MRARVRDNVINQRLVLYLILLASDQESQAPVLAGAHLDLGAGGALNAGQFLVGIAAESFMAPPFLRRNMEHLYNAQINNRAINDLL